MPDIPLEAVHETLETEMRALALEVKKHREHPGLKSLSDRELIKRSVKAMEVPETNAPKVIPPANFSAQSIGPLPAYAQHAPDDVKLEIAYLVDMAFHRGGVAKANALAKKSDLFVLDAFHDVVAGKLYEQMKKRGLL